MPKGEFEQYCYYIPNSLLRENEEKGTIRVSIPQTFTVNLLNRNAEKDEEKKIEMGAEDYIEQVKGKTAEEYEQYQRPSETKQDKFSANEKQLRENVPEEMRNRPNWVVVRTKQNAETGRLEKYLIDIHTGKFAESDNPATWASFDDAAKYAKENGGVTLAYALDGKDGIFCIDLDNCVKEDGSLTNVAKQVLQRSTGTYTELSVSEKGFHIFGKTDGLNLRAFSKDGGSEFYQKSHFIAMTGCLQNDTTKLADLDELPVKGYLLEHHATRSNVNGVGKGVEGLSSMSDRDVVEKAIASKGGDTFKALYSGQDLQNNHSNSDMSLMNRLAFWCNGDKEQMLRIFATSGLFRENKSPDYYEGTAIKAIRDTASRFQPKTQAPVNNKPIGNGSGKGGK
jgi:putative DNA primase/helicase